MRLEALNERPARLAVFQNDEAQCGGEHLAKGADFNPRELRPGFESDKALFEIIHFQSPVGCDDATVEAPAGRVPSPRCMSGRAALIMRVC